MKQGKCQTRVARQTFHPTLEPHNPRIDVSELHKTGICLGSEVANVRSGGLTEGSLPEGI